MLLKPVQREDPERVLGRVKPQRRDLRLPEEQDKQRLPVDDRRRKVLDVCLEALLAAEDKPVRRDVVEAERVAQRRDKLPGRGERRKGGVLDALPGNRGFVQER